MPGPSLDAIRRFKEQQEKKKQEEDARRIKEKLSTLEHRAAQGDRKAKTKLKQIEKVKDELQKPPEPKKQQQQVIHKAKQAKTDAKNQLEVSKKLKTATNFADLMKLAKHNNNELKKEEPKPEKVISPKTLVPKLLKPQSATVKAKAQPESSVSNRLPIASQKQHVIRKVLPHAGHLHPKQPVHYSNRPRQVTRAPVYEEEEEDEDEYEEDDFVVDEDDDEIQDEVSRTIRSVFRYDKRRCDRREEELDRQYRAIGRVSTFEDLEREERRASRLAAAEDAMALREEEERKRMKKLRLKRYN